MLLVNEFDAFIEMIDSCQPAFTAQADMSQSFVLYDFFIFLRLQGTIFL